ncbi:hypothetical protein AGMMS50268_18180 [Spirochaetia bacterium]|nr:hypothetical protein AGMMS50268_18180 [Spirochaetia bacterium]
MISRKIKNGTLIRNTAGFLDTENPVNSRYASRRRLKSNNQALESVDVEAGKKPPPIDFTSISEYEIAEYAGLPQRLLGLTLRELVIKFKGMDGMDRYVKMLRDLSAADEKDQKVQERRLQLVEKDFVIARLFQYLDVLMRQILEYPESAVDGIIALVQAEGGAVRQEVSRTMEIGLSRIIKDSKDQIIKELSGLRSKYQEKDGLDEKIKEAVAEAIEED